LIQILGREVGIAHHDVDAVVFQDSLKGQNVAAPHDAVTGEGVAQDMGELAARQI
jgi:hypothetical protein